MLSLSSCRATTPGAASASGRRSLSQHRRHAKQQQPIRRRTSPSSSKRLFGAGPPGDTHLASSTVSRAAPDDAQASGNAQRSALLAQRAAAIARKLLEQQRQQACAEGGSGDTSGTSPPLLADAQSLTPLLTSLLGTLADAASTTNTTTGNDITQAGGNKNKASAGKTTAAGPTAASDNNASSISTSGLLETLTQWADEFLVVGSGSDSGAGGAGGGASRSSTEGAAAAVAKQLFMQLLSELLPPDQPPATPTAARSTASGSFAVDNKNNRGRQQGPAAAGGGGGASVGRGLLAATAAAFTAREAASRMQQRWQQQGELVVSKTTGRGDHKDNYRASTDSFDPDAWEEAARAAAEAADAEEVRVENESTPTITPATAAAAVATNTTDFCPDAWELAAAAASAASAEEAPASSGFKRSSLPERCWAVKTLTEALRAAAHAAQLYSSSQRSDKSNGGITKGASPSVQELLLLPATDAADQLLQLCAVDRAGLLLVLCGAPASTSTTATAQGYGSRGDAWLLMVLEGVRPALGLLEMGVLLAAVHDRFGAADVFLKAATTFLPLTDTTDPSLTLSPAAAPPPAAALQALLLHWLLQPQLAAAGLPLLPEPLLLRLLPQVVSAGSIRQVTQAAHWGSVWPVTKLQPAPVGDNSASGSRSSSSSANTWQVTEPQLDAVVQSEAWCGLTGVPLSWLAHVAAAAAARLMHGTSSTSYSGSSHSGQLSEGAAAAANDARAVLTALIRGFEPAEPLVLLLLQHVHALPPGTAGMAAASAASEQHWKQLQLQELLLQAYSGTGLPVVGLCDVVHRSLCCLARAGGSNSPQQQRVLNAAAALFAALPADKLQAELRTLLALQADNSTATTASAQRYLASILAATAAAADSEQAAALLAVLPEPYWADAWATFVSPVAGSFCWTRQQLVASMQSLIPAAVSGGSAAASNLSWQKLQAAWQAVAAHFNLQAVVQEMSTTTTTNRQTCTAEGFVFSKPFIYRRGVPFVGDGWDQDGSVQATPTAFWGSGPSHQQQNAPAPCFTGSLGAFVAEVLAAAPLPVAAAHIAALVELLPAQAFARLAAVVVPRLVDAMDSLAPTAFSNTLGGGASSSPAAAALASGNAAAAADGSSGLDRLAKSLLKLYGTFPDLAEAPLALQLLAAAGPHLPVDQLPSFLAATAGLAIQLKHMPWVPGAADSNAYSSSSDSYESSPELSAMQQLELVVAAAASGRDNVALQHMLSHLVRRLPLKEAHTAFRVLQGLGGSQGLATAHQQLPYDAVEQASVILRQRCDEAAASRADVGSETAAAGGGGWASTRPYSVQPHSSSNSRGDEEKSVGGEAVVWQLGQSDAAADTPAAAREALGSFVQGWGSSNYTTNSSNNSSSSSGFFGAGSFEADRVLVRRLAEIVADIPAAPPQGSWPMDAMHDPSYTAPLLKRCLALLVDWTPSCPSAAALAAQQINTLAHKRQWAAAETSAFLQRLPLTTALQLLLETSSSSGGVSGGGSQHEVLLKLRPKLLRALVDWQGSEAVTQGLRELLVVGYKAQGLVSFAGLLADLRLALSSPTAAAADSFALLLHDGTTAPNAYVAAVLEVLDVLLPTTMAATAARFSGSWSQKLALALLQVSTQVPEAVSAGLSEQVARSFTDAQQLQKPGATATTATAAWQGDVAALLAALPAVAAGAATGQQQAELWVPLATAIATAVAEAAGSTAVLQTIRATFQAAKQQQGPAHSSTSAWAAQLPAVLGQLQQQGVLTCGVAYSMLAGVSTGGDSSMGAGFASKPGGPITPSCISLQLQQLLQDLLHTDRAVSLQQAAAAIVAVREGLGKALPMTVATVLGGGSFRTIRGYGASGPDAVEAAAALEAATADVAGRFQPTAAALPAATAAAARQLSEALARCHELLGESTMTDLMAALAAVLPWTDIESASTAGAASSGSSSSSSGSKTTTTCPAETDMAQGGWLGVTQVLLITSSLLTASCRVWGVDKGTQVAASLIEKLTAPTAAAAEVAVSSQAAAAGVGTEGGQGLGRSLSSSSATSGGERRRQLHNRGVRGLRRAASTGSALWKARLFGSSSRGGDGSSSSHASRAEAALFKAAAASSEPRAHADRASAKLAGAAATGSAAAAGSHAAKAAAALRTAAHADSNSSSSHASRAEAALLQAATADVQPGSHAARAKYSLLHAAASGLMRYPSTGGDADAASSSSSTPRHADHAQAALLQALASSHTTNSSSSRTSGTVPSEAVWGTQQLLSAADAWSWPGLTSGSKLVQGVLYPKYYNAASAGADSSSEKVVSPCEAAAALAAALPLVMSDMPTDLVAEVLGQTWGLIPSADWRRCLQTTVVAAAQAGGEEGSATRAQLLQATASSLERVLEPSMALPAAYSELLVAGVVTGSSSGVVQQQLLQQMVTTDTMDSSGWAQLLLELSRPDVALEALSTTSSSSSSSSDKDSASSWQQLELVARAAAAVFGNSSSGGGSVAAGDVADALAGRLYFSALLPRTYLTLLLQPYLSTAQREVCVKQLGLNTSDAPAALSALAKLCNNSSSSSSSGSGRDVSAASPGRSIPLGSYAQVLATALDVTRQAGFKGVSFPEARLGLEMEQRQTLKQLLAAVVTVLGPFRGMRQLLASPLGAQLLLPLHDLAAVLCYSWQLLPSEAATALTASVAAALAATSAQHPSNTGRNSSSTDWYSAYAQQQQRKDDLATLLQLLPNAAAAGFGKGPELWRPLLHVAAVAGGMSDAQEGGLVQKLLAVAAQQVPSYPLRVDGSVASGPADAGGVGVGEAGGKAAGFGGRFAPPVAVTAALSQAAGNNEVGLSAGRVSRATAAAGAADGQPGAGTGAGVASDGAAAAATASTASTSHHEEQEECVEDLDLSETDTALLTTAAAAYLCAALTGFTPLVVFMGSMSTLLVAALGATQNSADNASSSTGTNKGVQQQQPDSGTDSAPANPRTPITSDVSSNTASRAAAMGGRTKRVTFASASPAAADTHESAALGYAAAATAAATAAAAANRSGSAGVLGLGSLSVDPDDVIKKIKGHSSQLPLDEALMELVPLLLLPADSSSYTWPLLGLSAVLHTKFPRMHSLSGGSASGASLTNMALAATFVNPDGPLAAVMRASELLAASSGAAEGRCDGGSSRGVVDDEGDGLLAALTAAEAVHPHAVAMQLAERLLNALWAVLTGNATNSNNSASTTSAAAVSTPEGASAAWQEIATALLWGVSAESGLKLLGGFAHRQQGNWEAQLRAVAVAAALQQPQQGLGGQDVSRGLVGRDEGARANLLSGVLAQVCAGNNYPPLAFLSLLLNHTVVPLSSSNTAAVLEAALGQVVSTYGTTVGDKGGQQGDNTYSSTSSGGGVGGSGSSGGANKKEGLWGGGVGTTGEFDSWGFDATLLADQGFADALQGFSSSSGGPQYRSTSGFGANSSNGSNGWSRAKLSAVPANVISQVNSLVKGACARGHAAAAVSFLTQLLQLSRSTTSNTALVQQQSAVLVLDSTQEQQLLQQVVLAVDKACCSGAGGDASCTTTTTAAQLSDCMCTLLAVLADRGHLTCINQVVAVVCEALAAQHAQHNTSISSTTGVGQVSPALVGLVLTAAAEGVRRSEGGVLSAAKPAGARFLATAAESLFGGGGVGVGGGVKLSVEQCLVVLSAVCAHLPERLGLQIVAAAAGRLHSVMPQAVSIVRQVAVKDGS